MTDSKFQYRSAKANMYSQLLRMWFEMANFLENWLLTKPAVF